MTNELNSQKLFELVGNFKWLIQEVNGSGFDQYIKGEEFNLAAGSSEEFESIALNQKSIGEKTDIPFFLCIKPTWFVREGVLYLTLIAGNKAQELTRLIMWFDKLDCNTPEFKFEITSLLDNPFRGGGTPETVYAQPAADKESNEALTVSLAFMASTSGIRGMGIGH